MKKYVFAGAPDKTVYLSQEFDEPTRILCLERLKIVRIVVEVESEDNATNVGLALSGLRNADRSQYFVLPLVREEVAS